MRARFLSRFDWEGKDVYCYDDLDTGEVVYFNGGRHGEELKRFTPMDYSNIQGRTADVLPRADVFQFIRATYKPKKNPFSSGSAHIHWALPENK
jgi:hypothetical protein